MFTSGSYPTPRGRGHPRMGGQAESEEYMYPFLHGDSGRQARTAKYGWVGVGEQNKKNFNILIC